MQSVLVDFGVVEEQNKYGCGEVDCSIVEFRQGILEPQRWLNCVDAVGRERGSGNQHCGGGDGSVEGVSVEVAKPARTLQRRGRGGDTARVGTAWCQLQCVAPSWAGVSRVHAASASEDGRRAGFGELQRHGNNIVCMPVCCTRV